MTHPDPLDQAQLEAELRDLLRADADAVCHALTCPLCGVKTLALRALALAGWDEASWWNDVTAGLDAHE
jgi:hypothetical protein